MEYAIIETGGKQYKVHPGLVLDVDNLNVTDGSFSFDKVLLHVAGGDIKIGTPFLEGAVVTAKVLGDKKGEKVRVSKFKGKSRYRKTVGFRAKLTSVEIVSLGAVKKEKKAEEKKV